jgi:hypothetical protein
MKRFSFVLTLVLAVVFGGGWLFKDQDLVMKARLMFLNASGSNTITLHAGNANALQIVDDGGTTYATVTGVTGTTGIMAGGFTFSQPPVFASAATGITAHAGGTQAAAFALDATKFVHQVTTVGSAADSVALPTPIPGTCYLISNEAASNSMQLFAITPVTINGAATATGIAVAAKKGEFCCATTAATYSCAGI